MSLLLPKATFKTSNGVWLTSALFVELATHGSEYVIFTLKGDDHDGLMSFPKLFLSLTEKDPTEYTMALTVFESWDHWMDISSAAKLKPVIKKLREEVSIRQKSEAMKFMIDEVETKGKSSFAAAKLLLSKPWENTPTTPAQRKEAKRQGDREDKVVTDLFKADAKRLGILLN